MPGTLPCPVSLLEHRPEASPWAEKQCVQFTMFADFNSRQTALQEHCSSAQPRLAGNMLSNKADCCATGEPTWVSQLSWDLTCLCCLPCHGLGCGGGWVFL